MSIIQVTVTHSGFDDLPDKFTLLRKEFFQLMAEFIREQWTDWMATWRENRFPIEEKMTDATLVSWISNKNASGGRDNIPAYLNFGAARKAVMMEGYRAATAVGVIKSRVARGELNYVSDEVVGRIDARRVDLAVADEIENQFDSMMDFVWGEVFG